MAIIGNIEYDHADIYPDLAAVQRAFVHLMNIVPRRGLIVAGLETPALRELLPARALAGRDLRPLRGRGLAGGGRARRGTAAGASGSCSGGRDLGEFSLGLGGEHNLRNALAALAAANAVGVAPEAARDALAAFGGREAPAGGAGQRARRDRVYDDFAHHPTAVRETLRALRAVGPAGRRAG